MTHSWWDVAGVGAEDTDTDDYQDTELDWFTADYQRFSGEHGSAGAPQSVPSAAKTDLSTPQKTHKTELISATPLGWQCSPPPSSPQTEEDFELAALEPNTLGRLRWFLTTNQNRLLRELMGVVNLANVNHENICVINTCLVILLFVQRRGELGRVLQELREGVGEESEEEAERRRERGDKDLLTNFRELCFFWKEYYTHRGRDRLSIEFSSHIRFAEWQNLVVKLCADDGSAISLLDRKIVLPRSPYASTPKL